MRIPAEHQNDVAVSLATRAETPANPANTKTLVIVAVVVLGILILAIFIHLIYKSSAARQRANGSGRRGDRSRGEYSSQLQGDELSVTSGRREENDMEREMAAGNRNSTASGVDRSTSIRSIMTLPPYSPSARDNERILGREGERGGIDVVVEFPETQEEEEGRREDEMESLYQIRLARRAEQAEREERRRLRREARSRGDYQALAELRQRAEAAASDNVSSTLIAEHQAQDRSRRVSSVQYADLGVARHDGSRLRANSSESDRRPLLDSAASFGGSSIRPESTRTLSTHQRGRSASSVLSISTTASDELTPAHRTVSGGSINTDFEVVSLSNAHSRSPSVSRSVLSTAPGGDVGEQAIPAVDPPVYDELELEEAPPYSSPVQTRAPPLPANGSIDSTSDSRPRAPQLPGIERLPSIRITNATSPTVTTPTPHTRAAAAS